LKLKEILPHLYHTLRLKAMSKQRFLKRNSSKEIPVVVSLTTIESRLKVVHITIRSILVQEAMPKKVVLWVHKRFENNLPKSLRSIQGELLDIKFTNGDYSHRKLVHSLREFPDDIIVTIDDDVIYPTNFLKLLFESHQKYPRSIIANHTRKISFDTTGKLLPYQQWPHIKVQPENGRDLMVIGVFGVLYPPNALDMRVHDEDLFLELAPKADDLWFTSMAILAGTTIRLPIQRPENPILILGTQKISLKRSNKTKDLNRVQWENLSRHFNILLE
jgi:hypothetical protein